MFLYSKIPSKVFVFLCFVFFALLGVWVITAYPEIFQIYPLPAKINQVAPTEPIKLTFNYPISKNSFLFSEDFSIEPEIKGEIIFQDEAFFGFYKTIVFKPEIPLNLGANYTIKLANLRSIYGTRLKDYTFSFLTITPPKVKETIPQDKAKDVLINSDLKIILSQPNNYFDLKFSLEPKVEFEVLPNQEKTSYNLKPKQKLKQNTEYTLNVSTYYNFGSEEQSGVGELHKEGLINTNKISFQTQKPLEVVEIIPKDGQNKVATESAIEINFSELVDYKSLEEHLKITPEVKAEFIWQDSKLTLAPYEPLKEDTEYEVKLTSGILSYQDSSYSEKEFVYHFKTRSKFSEKVISKFEVTPQIKEGKYIDIDLAHQTLTIFENGQSLGSYKISTGKSSMPTPKGTFAIRNKALRAYSSTHHLWMPYWMAFTWMGHGIHELPEWAGGIKEGEAHLGIPVSHGCVRLGVGPAQRVYEWAEIGTPVIVH